MDLDTEALEITVTPDVVIATEEMDGHAIGYQGLKRCEYTGVTSRHYIPVLIPEIPDVAEKIECLRSFRRQRLKETGKRVLTRTRIAHVKSQMDIRKEVNALAHSRLSKNEYRSGHHCTINGEPAKL